MGKKRREDCIVDGCRAERKIGGRCHKHHEAAVASGEIEAGLTRMCLWEACGRPATARNLCGKHYWHFRFKGEFPTFEGDDIVWERAHEQSQERLTIAQAATRIRRVIVWLQSPRVQQAYPDYDFRDDLDTALDILENGPLPRPREIIDELVVVDDPRDVYVLRDAAAAGEASSGDRSSALAAVDRVDDLLVRDHVSSVSDEYGHQSTTLNE